MHQNLAIVQADHGNIQVQRQVGKGSTFTVCLPLSNQLEHRYSIQAAGKMPALWGKPSQVQSVARASRPPVLIRYRRSSA